VLSTIFWVFFSNCEYCAQSNSNIFQHSNWKSVKSVFSSKYIPYKGYISNVILNVKWLPMMPNGIAEHEWVKKDFWYFKKIKNFLSISVNGLLRLSIFFKTLAEKLYQFKITGKFDLSVARIYWFLTFFQDFQV
jgi:hypothetical protein